MFSILTVCKSPKEDGVNLLTIFINIDLNRNHIILYYTAKVRINSMRKSCV